MRIGQGYDVHAFEAGDHVMIGGVRIAHTHGLKAHSDGDVLLHAICDALLGAAGLGDIGKHFPDTQPEFKAISSITLLSHVVQQLSDHGYSLLNIDSTVVAQAPQLSPHIDDMREAISQACGLKATAVNVKATTTERLGFCGREEGIAAHAVCLIQSSQ